MCNHRITFWYWTSRSTRLNKRLWCLFVLYFFSEFWKTLMPANVRAATAVGSQSPPSLAQSFTVKTGPWATPQIHKMSTGKRTLRFHIFMYVPVKKQCTTLHHLTVLKVLKMLNLGFCVPLCCVWIKKKKYIFSRSSFLVRLDLIRLKYKLKSKCRYSCFSKTFLVLASSLESRPAVAFAQRLH